MESMPGSARNIRFDILSRMVQKISNRKLVPFEDCSQTQRSQFTNYDLSNNAADSRHAYRHQVAPILVVVATVVLFVPPLFTRAPFLSVFDFSVWGRDWFKLSNCIRHGAAACDTAAISKFPLGYLLNSHYASVMEAHGFEVSHAIGLLNTFFLALPIVLIVLINGLHASLPRLLIYMLAILVTAVP